MELLHLEQPEDLVAEGVHEVPLKEGLADHPVGDLPQGPC